MIFLSAFYLSVTAMVFSDSHNIIKIYQQAKSEFSMTQDILHNDQEERIKYVEETDIQKAFSRLLV